MGGDYIAGILQDTVRSSYFLLEKTVEKNACAKIMGAPFDDNEVLGLAQNVMLAIEALPEASQQKFDEQWQYALDIIEVFKPDPKSCYTTSGKGNRNFNFVLF